MQSEYYFNLLQNRHVEDEQENYDYNIECCDVCELLFGRKFCILPSKVDKSGWVARVSAFITYFNMLESKVKKAFALSQMLLWELEHRKVWNVRYDGSHPDFNNALYGRVIHIIGQDGNDIYFSHQFRKLLHDMEYYFKHIDEIPEIHTKAVYDILSDVNVFANEHCKTEPFS